MAVPPGGGDGGSGGPVKASGSSNDDDDDKLSSDMLYLYRYLDRNSSFGLFANLCVRETGVRSAGVREYESTGRDGRVDEGG